MCNGIWNIPSVKRSALCKERQGCVEGVDFRLTVTDRVTYPLTFPQFLAGSCRIFAQSQCNAMIVAVRNKILFGAA